MQSDFHPLPSVFNGETMGWQTTAPYGQDQGDKSENPNQLRFVVAEAIALLWAPDKIHFQRVWAARPFILNLLHTEPTPSQQEAEGAAAQQELQHSRCVQSCHHWLLTALWAEVKSPHWDVQLPTGGKGPQQCLAVRSLIPWEVTLPSQLRFWANKCQAVKIKPQLKHCSELPLSCFLRRALEPP